MKNPFCLSFLLFMLISNFVYGQIEINASDFASEGDGYIYAVKHFKPKELYITDLETKKWNVSDIEPDDFDTLRIYNKDRSKFGKLFSNSNLVKFHSRRDMEFIYKDTNSIKLEGLVNDYLGLKTSVLLVFPRELDLYKFPIKQGTYLRDSIQKKFVSCYGLTQFADSVRMDIDMDHTAYFDTCIEVKTPYEKYFALREKNTVIKIITAYKNSHFIGWTPASEYSVKEKIITYRFFVKNVGAPVMEVVSDHNGMVSLIRYQFIEPMTVELSKTDVNCKGAEQGSITANVKGGVPDFKYLWSNGKKTKTIKNLKAGSYSVVVTDSKGTKVEQSITINEPDEELKLKLEYSNIKCYSDHNAFIHANVTGGTKPYYIVWSNDVEAEQINNLGSGIYGCIVKDSLRCFTWDSVQITAPSSPFNFTPKVTHSKCKGENNGVLQFDYCGGDAPYTFFLNDQNVEQLVPNLSAGIYTMKAIDGNGCELTRQPEIKEPEQKLDAEGKITHVNCYGMNNGSIVLKVSGGTPGYKYQWNNEATTKDLNNITQGIYNVIITDLYKCKTEKTFVVNAPEESLKLNFDVKHVTCKGGSDGNIITSATGGTPPYNIVWSNKNKNYNLENIKAGNYTINITDNNNCLITQTITINEPEQGIEIEGEVTDSPCKNNNLGSVSVSIKGGNSPYNYKWSNGVKEPSLSNIYPGNYTLNVTDKDGCFSTKTFTISSPEKELIANIETTPTLCYDSEDGKVSISVSGGVPGYEIMVDNQIINPGAVQLLKAGKYKAVISDNAGCVLQKEFEIKSNPKLEINVTTKTPSENKPNGTAELFIIGGTAPYKIHWNDGFTELKRKQMGIGEYYINVTDKNGCTTEREIIFE
ncbi:MAG: SprB repeat-containing protein [Bacteroidales bacterium]|nr:SprB repeat-containing protein [Bacteroidales bacterium]